MIYPSFEEINKKARGFDFIPVAMDDFADMETPVSVFKRFKDTNPYCFLLDSVEGGEKWARYSFIGKDPLLTIRIKEQEAIVQYRDGRTEKKEGNPFSLVQEMLSHYKSPQIEGIPRLSGGAVGYFGYDLVRSVEYLPDAPQDDLMLPDAHFMVVDEMIVFDHLKQKLVLIVNMPTAGDLRLNYDRACERLRSVARVIRNASPMPGNGAKKRAPEKTPEPVSNMDKAYYCEMVEKAKEHILGGDIFQVVVSQRFGMPVEDDPLDIYRRLRVSNPSPYMYYLKFDDTCIVGASPEMLLRCEDGVVETCPIAGTRKRGGTAGEDDALEKELLADEKELAEHVMLVDLGRNDIGKVSQFGSVQVTEYMKILRYSHVMHIGSTVQGRLRDGLNAFDALMAVLPAGTLSGAPKIRAMQIIDAMEPTRRGPYGGAIGYISFDGNLDCCITIRTIVFKDGMAYVQAGAGIVADSVPETEYEESCNKAKALFKAIEEAGALR
ncbi:MAG: anthranilate synthase component I [Bacillota bacterium]